MIPTPIGAIVFLVGVWLLFRPAVEMLIFVLGCSLLAGASALDAVALGHSSIPPNMLALAFLALRLFRKDFRRSSAIIGGLRLNAWLLIFCIYGAASALILPRIFAGRFMVYGMQYAKALTPLTPSSQNITQGLYILGTGLAAVAASAVMMKTRAFQTLPSALVLITWVHISTGMVDAVASAAHIKDVFGFVRNGAYAQLDQSVVSYHRISGMTPEPSTYAGLGAVFTVFLVELWLRGVAPRRTGVTALAMLAMLLLSTSSTAYLFVASYAAILAVRFVLFPTTLGVGRAFALFIVSGAVLLAGIATVLLVPSVGRQISDVVLSMTVEKSASSSGMERAAWARQGWDLFVGTRGLGVGIGSFRSSNFFTAVLGSVGPAGLVLFLVYVLQVFKPLRGSTYGKGASPPAKVGAAAAWVPVVGLIPAAFAGTSADPGLLFGLFCGCALALRSSSAPPPDEAAGSGTAQAAAQASQPSRAPATQGAQ